MQYTVPTHLTYRWYIFNAVVFVKEFGRLHKCVEFKILVSTQSRVYVLSAELVSIFSRFHAGRYRILSSHTILMREDGLSNC